MFAAGFATGVCLSITGALVFIAALVVAESREASERFKDEL